MSVVLDLKEDGEFQAPGDHRVFTVSMETKVPRERVEKLGPLVHQDHQETQDDLVKTVQKAFLDALAQPERPATRVTEEFKANSVFQAKKAPGAGVVDEVKKAKGELAVKRAVKGHQENRAHLANGESKDHVELLDLLVLVDPRVQWVFVETKAHPAKRATGAFLDHKASLALEVLEETLEPMALVDHKE